jgi:hypothetical protein
VSERTSGTWNRASVAGVTPITFMLSHFIEGLSIMVFLNMEIFFYLLYLLSPEISWKALALASSIFFLENSVGLLFGLFFSIIMKTAWTSTLVSQTSLFFQLFLSGVFVHAVCIKSLFFIPSIF